MKHLFALSVVASFAAAAAATIGGAAALPACDPDQGGIKLPDGFCALVVAESVGQARHIAVASNGDLYIAKQGGRGGRTPGIVALRDTNGDGKADLTETFGEKSSTGIGFRNGYLYVATTNSVERYKMTPGELKPAAPPEVIVTDLPPGSPHQDKGLAFDGRGSLYINVGAPSNACQAQDRKEGLAGQDPCPLLEKYGGVWKFDENKPGQKEEDGTHYATGMRQMPAITWHNGALYVVMNNRDQLDTLWPERFTAEENATRPAEPMFRVEQGGNYGWPFCFYDFFQNKLLLNPEYGGDGKTVGRCADFKMPIAAFPAHWAPVDVTFYTGTQFPKKYQGGAFIAFHGSWNRAPTQDGYNVTFQPFAGDKPSGKFEVFAGGFEGPSPPKTQNNAAYRADGVAEGPDGSLYVADSVKGRVWRVVYRGAAK
jgi:glucose/arabinose dehydrogenase